MESMELVLQSDASSSDLSDMSNNNHESILNDLNELIAQTEQLSLQHQEALDMMNRIHNAVNAVKNTDTIYISYNGHLVDLDTILTEFHQLSLNVIKETGKNPFGELLLTVL